MWSVFITYFGHGTVINAPLCLRGFLVWNSLGVVYPLIWIMIHCLLTGVLAQYVI